jgi:hypothetical protein
MMYDIILQQNCKILCHISCRMVECCSIPWNSYVVADSYYMSSNFYMVSNPTQIQNFENFTGSTL